MCEWLDVVWQDEMVGINKQGEIMKKKKVNETYKITPKGLISLNAGELTDAIWDALKLYCYENNYSAILVNKEGGKFINVELVDEK